MMIAGLILFLFASTVIACNENLPTSSIALNGYTLTVELAVTPSARACGLSHRSSLEEYRGMLFLYPNPRPLSFWMENTKIRLSIAFIDETGRILSIQKMVPMEIEEKYQSPKPVRYALEVNQGWFAKHNIAVGDVIDLEIPAKPDNSGPASDLRVAPLQ
jgi:uncharacterized membrane protein (UPF0127 family)